MPATPKTYKATVRTVTPQSPTITTIRFDVKLKFEPSQSVSFALPNDPKKRYFSISSSPLEGPFIEVTIKNEPNTPLAQGIASLKRGDVLEIEGPFGGALAAPETVKEPLIYIAAGSGVTPLSFGHPLATRPWDIPTGLPFA